MAVDYTQFKQGGDSTISPYVMQNKWWKLKGPDQAANLFGILKYLQQNQSLRTTQLITSTRLYGNISLMGLNGLTYSKLASVNSSNQGRITYNICQSVVDTIVAKIAKNKPKPLFLTSGAEYKKQRRAKKLTKFVDGVFYENKTHELGVQIFRDASIWGTGVAFVYVQDGRIKYERVIPSEIYVDEVDAFYGAPRSIYRVKAVDRQVLLEMFPNKSALIMQANQAKPDDLGTYPTISDQITVCEAWHLPSGPEASDGKHIWTLYNGTLFEESYEEDHFPFEFMHWSKKLFGFWGQGLVEQIQNIQLEVNKLLWVIQRSMHLAGSFKILLENGSKIVKEHLNNDIGSIVNYSGTMPQYVTPPIVPPEIYAHLQTLKNAAYEQAGISQLSAAAKKPDGLDSGKALREFNDIESDRFMTVGQMYEQFFVGLAEKTVCKLEQLHEEGESYSVKVPDKQEIELLDYADVQMDKDDYVLKCYPVSALPNEPAGRLQTIQELMQAGLITPEAGRRLLDYPDLEAEEELANASQDYLHEILEKMVDEGIYTAPEPLDNLTKARELTLQYYAKYKCTDLEEERLDLLRTFLSQIDMIQLQASQPVAGPAGAAPQAVPEAPAQSDLLPNAPQGAPLV